MDRIVISPQIHLGKPVVEGTRITLESVLELIGEGLSFEQIIKDYYPDLENEDIQACVRYAIALVAAETTLKQTDSVIKPHQRHVFAKIYGGDR